MKYLRHVLVLAILACWTATAASQIPTKVKPDDTRNGPKVVQAFRPAVAKPSEATVRVLADGKEVAYGAIVGADGFILTKWSEVHDRGKITCKFKDGKVLDAKIVGVKDDEVKSGAKEPTGAYDLAMLKVNATGLTTIQWRSSKDATVGKWVASVGIGADPIAVGVVSVGPRKWALFDQPPKQINLNAGYLGVQLADADDGARITGVAKKTAAEKVGLKVNDIVYEAAGRKVVSAESFMNAVGRYRPGEKVLLKVKRGEEDMKFEPILGKRDPKVFGANPQETMGTSLSTRRGGFPTILQHDSGLRPEDCGGPLVDLDGKVVGINIARAGRTETYAIPSDDIQPLLGDLKSGKLAPKDDLAKTVPVPKNDSLILTTTGKLNDKDTLYKNRPGRFMKTQEVKFSAGVNYAIELRSAEFDAYLILEDAQGLKLAEDNDSGGSTNAKIVFRAPRDEAYRIVILSFNGNETGNYTLTVRKLAEPEKK